MILDIACLLISLIVIHQLYLTTITWAMYGKEKVKQDKDKCFRSLGDKIDKKISGMQHNQTNGIPHIFRSYGFYSRNSSGLC